jgi:hypothetical protein
MDSSSILHGQEIQMDRAATDLPPVFDAFVNGAAEVDADQDA